MSQRYDDRGVDVFDDDLEIYDDDPIIDPDYPPGTDVETILHRIAEQIRSARPMPLSASAMINKDEVLELVEEAMARLPEELRAARWMLKERDEYLDRVTHEGEDLLATARARAESLVQKTEVVRSANQRARQITLKANEDARRLRLEAEDYCDQKLGSFEIVLERTMKTVRAGREKLQGPAPQIEAPPEQPVEPGNDFFDQDLA